MKDRVAVGLSGGVTSAVAAALLKQQGFDVVGVHLQVVPSGKSGLVSLFGSHCVKTSSEQIAKKFCEQNDIPYYLVDVGDIFLNEVVDHFTHESLQARKPSPCVVCNSKIKLGCLAAKADELGIDKIATGHRAQIVPDPESGFPHIYQSVDKVRDRSHFLYEADPEILKRTMMPMGSFTASLIEKLAIELGLVSLGVDLTAQSPGEPCFVSDPFYIPFVEKRSVASLRMSGVVKNVKREPIGEHKGLFTFLIGQDVTELYQDRRKLEEKLYVAGFDRVEKSVIIGEERFLHSREAFLRKMRWLQKPDNIKGLKCRARMSSPDKGEVDCTVTSLEGSSAHVEFTEVVRAVGAGSFVVFYRGEELLGGGTVDRVVNVQTVMPTKEEESAKEQKEAT